MSDLNIGIIGAGNIGTRQARFWSRVAGANVIGIADNNQEAAERLAQNFVSATAFTSAEALLARTDIQAVHVCVPTHLHRDIVLAAAQAGKHILCEKPMALSLEDCDAMSEAAQSAGVILSVGHVVRFFPEYAQAKRLLGAGKVGVPAIARTRRAGAYPATAWFSDSQQSGGVIADLVVHDLDWLLWCFGPVERVFAKITNAPRFEYALITLRHRSGVISHVEGIWGEPGGFHATFEIAGSAGLLTQDSRKSNPFTVGARPVGDFFLTLPGAPQAPENDPYFRQVQAFANALRGSAPLVVTPAEARTAVQVALAALESARTGNAIELEVTHA